MPGLRGVLAICIFTISSLHALPMKADASFLPSDVPDLSSLTSEEQAQLWGSATKWASKAAKTTWGGIRSTKDWTKGAVDTVRGHTQTGVDKAGKWFKGAGKSIAGFFGEE